MRVYPTGSQPWVTCDCDNPMFYVMSGGTPTVTFGNVTCSRCGPDETDMTEADLDALWDRGTPTKVRTSPHLLTKARVARLRGTSMIDDPVFTLDEWLHKHLPWRAHTLLFKWLCNWADMRVTGLSWREMRGQRRVPAWTDSFKHWSRSP